MKIILPFAIAGAIASANPALAVPTTLWAVEASATGSGVSNNAYAEQFSLGGALLQRVTLGSGFNPTGIAIVGNTGYVSSDTTGLLYTFSLTTGALGPRYTTGQNALGPLTFDGTNLLAGDATGGNSVYRLSLTGASLGSFKIGLCGSYCNGLEYEAGALIANRSQNDFDQSSSVYDRYSTTGTLLQANAFTAGDGGAVAYNPDNRTQYAAISGGQGGYQTSPGGTIVTFGGTIADSGFGTSDRFFNDFAVQVPEPTTLALLGAGLGLLGFGRRRV